MSVVGDNIHALRLMHNMTQQELADVADVTRETVNKWETGTIGNIRTNNLNRLRAHFDLSIDDLRSETNGLAAQMTRGAASTEPTDKPAQIPVMRSAPFGPTMLGMELEGLVEVPAPIRQRHPRSFAFVADDSLNRVLPEGCHAIIDPDASPSPNSIVLADADNGAPSPVFRRLRRDEHTATLSIDSYTRVEDDVVMDINDLHIIGTVVWYQPRKELG